MTVKEVKAMFSGEYADCEVYEAKSHGAHYPNYFRASNCDYTDEYNDNSEVGLWELMNEEDYNYSLYAEVNSEADFGEWLGDKNAKILCIMLADAE